MNWNEITIHTSKEGAEPLCGRLMNIGVNGFSISDPADLAELLENKSGKWDYIDESLLSSAGSEVRVTVYTADNAQGAGTLELIKSEVKTLKSEDQAGLFGSLETYVGSVCEEDWAENWKRYFKPFDIGRKLTVKPSWEDLPPGKENRIVLEIDPGSSFGTGQHATTKLCLEILESFALDGKRLLDIGCGSGILSAAGLLLGCSEARAADIDENSVKTAAETVSMNNIPAGRFAALCGDIAADEALRKKLGGNFDIIVSNITADILIALSPFFRGFLSGGGTVILSGIIDGRTEDVTAAMESQGFTLSETKEDEGWAALIFA